MNISSVLIMAKIGFGEAVSKEVAGVKHCSVELRENEKIIAVIEAPNLDEELASYKTLEKLANVASVNMVFSYQNLDEQTPSLNANETLEKLNSLQDAKNISYNGDLKAKF